MRERQEYRYGYTSPPKAKNPFELRGTHENSNYILVRIPVEINSLVHGEHAFALAEGSPLSSFALSIAEVIRLQERGLLQRSNRPTITRQPTDYPALQQT